MSDIPLVYCPMCGNTSEATWGIPTVTPTPSIKWKCAICEQEYEIKIGFYAKEDWPDERNRKERNSDS